MIKVGGVYPISDVVRTDRFQIPFEPFTRIGYANIEKSRSSKVGRDGVVSTGDLYETDPIRVVIIKDSPALFSDLCNAASSELMERFLGSEPYIAWYSADDTFCGYSSLADIEPYEEVNNTSASWLSEFNTDYYGRTSVAARNATGPLQADLRPVLTEDTANHKWYEDEDRAPTRDELIAVEGVLYPLEVAPDSVLTSARGKVVTKGYIITNPGGMDSDGVVQRNPLTDSTATVANYPTITEHKGTARVLSMVFEPRDRNEDLPKVEQFNARAARDPFSSGVDKEREPSDTALENKNIGVSSRKVLKLRINKMDNDALLTRGQFMMRNEILIISSVESFNTTGELELTAYRELK